MSSSPTAPATPSRKAVGEGTDTVQQHGDLHAEREHRAADPGRLGQYQRHRQHPRQSDLRQHRQQCAERRRRRGFVARRPRRRHLYGRQRRRQHRSRSRPRAPTRSTARSLSRWPQRREPHPHRRGAINGTGNTQNNIINGNVGANTLDGGVGADTMAGGRSATTSTSSTSRRRGDRERRVRHRRGPELGHLHARCQCREPHPHRPRRGRRHRQHPRQHPSRQWRRQHPLRRRRRRRSVRRCRQ